MDAINSARVHRFGDKVAVRLGEGNLTVYLTPELSKKLARLLVTYGEDCEMFKFTESQLGTATI